jgi:hypothetical protein
MEGISQLLASNSSKGIKFLYLHSGPGLNAQLDGEHSGDDVWLVLRPTSATVLHVLGILGCDDVLACFGVVQNRRGVREEAVEAPVEDARRHEGVDVADSETEKIKALASHS